MADTYEIYNMSHTGEEIDAAVDKAKAEASAGFPFGFLFMSRRQDAIEERQAELRRRVFQVHGEDGLAAGDGQRRGRRLLQHLAAEIAEVGGDGSAADRQLQRAFAVVAAAAATISARRRACRASPACCRASRPRISTGNSRPARALRRRRPSWRIPARASAACPPASTGM